MFNSVIHVPQIVVAGAAGYLPRIVPAEVEASFY